MRIIVTELCTRREVSLVGILVRRRSAVVALRRGGVLELRGGLRGGALLELRTGLGDHVVARVGRRRQCRLVLHFSSVIIFSIILRVLRAPLNV